MKGSAPPSAACARAPGSGTNDGGLVFSKSGTSCPVHSPASASHHTYALASLHGLPEGSAEARLYRIRRFAGQAQPHSSATQDCSVHGLRRAVWFTPPANEPAWIHDPHEVDPSSAS